MRIALVSDDMEKLLHSTFVKKLENMNDVRILDPLTEEEYGNSADGLLKQEISTAPFYRCDVVLYMAFGNWERLMYTMEKVLGFAVVNKKGNYDKNTLMRYVALLIPENKINVNELPKHLHWYNRSIHEIYNRYEKFNFNTGHLSLYFKTFLGVSMSMDKIIGRVGEE